VEYVSIKPIDPEYVYKNLALLISNHTMSESFRHRDSGQTAQLHLVSPENDWNMKWTEPVSNYLERLGVDVSLHSAYCTMQAIKYKMNCIELDQYETTKRIYERVAFYTSQNVSPHSIEHSIRTTIKEIKNIRNSFYEQLFGNEKLSAMRFIHISGQHLLRSLQCAGLEEAVAD
jgi:hypothetical protein